MEESKFFSTFVRPKADIKEILDLIKQYGENTTLKEILEYRKKHSPYKFLKYKCPKCQGLGYIVTEYNGYPSGLPDSGWVYKAAYDYKKCDLCEGMGYTEKEYKPKTKVVGYEEV